MLPFLVALAAVTALAWLIRNQHRKLQGYHGRVAEPKTIEDRFAKLCYITKKTAKEIFFESAQITGVRKHTVENDFKKYIESEYLPSYVMTFLEDGKEYIDSVKVPKLTYWEH